LSANGAKKGFRSAQGERQRPLFVVLFVSYFSPIEEINLKMSISKKTPQTQGMRRNK
jgi:hypothetical protein